MGDDTMHVERRRAPEPSRLTLPVIIGAMASLVVVVGQAAGMVWWSANLSASVLEQTHRLDDSFKRLDRLDLSDRERNELLGKMAVTIGRLDERMGYLVLQAAPGPGRPTR